MLRVSTADPWPDHPDTLTAGGNLAVWYQAVGRTAEAIERGERVVADSERILGFKHPAR